MFDDTDNLDALVLRRIQRFDRDSPARRDELEELADHLGVTVGELGESLRRHARAHRGVIRVSGGGYAFDRHAKRDPGVGGNRKRKRGVRLGHQPGEMRRSLARKALAGMIDMGEQWRANVRRLDEKIDAGDIVPLDVALRQHDQRHARSAVGLIDWLTFTGHAWQPVEAAGRRGVVLDDLGAGRWFADAIANWCLRQAAIAGFGRRRIGSVENYYLVTVGQALADEDLSAAGLGTPKQIGDRRTYLRRKLGWDLRDRPGPDELDPLAAAEMTARDALLEKVRFNGAVRFFLPLVTLT